MGSPPSSAVPEKKGALRSTIGHPVVVVLTNVRYVYILLWPFT